MYATVLPTYSFSGHHYTYLTLFFPLLVLSLHHCLVTNSSKIDKSFETILNWLFYAVAITIILGQLGYSPMALFLSISGVILAFAFMIGSASSKYFEGLLFIILRRPYAIGDGIHVMGKRCLSYFLFCYNCILCLLIFSSIPLCQVSRAKECTQVTRSGMWKM